MEKPRIWIIFHGWFPSERAAGLWVGKVAEGFGEQGFETTLLVPYKRHTFGNAFEKYHLKQTFTLRTPFALDVFDVPLLNYLAFWISALSFAGACLWHLRHASRSGIIYANDPHIVWFLSFFFNNIFYELHVVPTEKLSLYRSLFKRMCGFVAITKWGKTELTKRFYVSPDHVLVAPSGIEIEKFDIPSSKEEARRALSLDPGKPIALYTGHLYEWKGVHTLAEAARLLPDVEVLFVGGAPKDIEAFKKTYGHIDAIRIVGYRPHDEIPLWQKAADVLVLPNTATKRISKYNTSPMKLFEYMASGRPIVASDVPSIREIVSKETACLVTPDDPEALAEGIQRALGDREGSQARAKRARETVERYSWDKRMQHIAAFVRASTKNI